MSIIRLTKEFNFDMAHALWNYDGKCKNIHGHSYRLMVTVIGKPIDDVNNVKNGMVIDFGELKTIIYKLIVDVYDHALLLNRRTPFSFPDELKQMYERCIFVDYQPTCENMLPDFAEKISLELPTNIKLHSLRLYETPSSYGEWFASDNMGI